MAIKFTDEAKNEFDAALDWYSVRSTTAARGFLAEVSLVLAAIAATPDSYTKTYAGCRQARLKRYPYCVVYLQHNQDVVIVAIAHAKRRPGYWKFRR